MFPEVTGQGPVGVVLLDSGMLERKDTERQAPFSSSSYSEIHSLVSTFQQLQNLKWSYFIALLEPFTEMSLHYSHFLV